MPTRRATGPVAGFAAPAGAIPYDPSGRLSAAPGPATALARLPLSTREARVARSRSTEAIPMRKETLAALLLFVVAAAVMVGLSLIERR